MKQNFNPELALIGLSGNQVWAGKGGQTYCDMRG